MKIIDQAALALCIGAGAMASASAVAGTLYRCTDASGHSEFRQTPCAAGSRTVGAQETRAVRGTTHSEEEEHRLAAAASGRTPPSTDGMDAKLTLHFTSVQLQFLLQVLGDFTQRQTSLGAGVNGQALAAIDFNDIPASQALKTLQSLYRVRVEWDEHAIRVSTL